MDIEESKILLKDFQKGKIEKDKLEHYRGSYKMGYFYTVGIQEAIETVLSELEKKEKIIDKALEIAFQYGQIDGEHHKLWVIDQIVENLTGDKYKEFIEKYRYDEETGDYYSWDKGIAP